jgi:serine/threonine protein kinase
MEIAILERLNTQDHANIHKYHGYRLDMRRLRWRLYHDYCDYGSLGLALSYNVNFDEPRVSEAFLWHVLRSLIDASLVLERGNDKPADKGTWNEIIHRDISLANIFAGYPLDDDGSPNATRKAPLLAPTPQTLTMQVPFYAATTPTWPQIYLADFDQSFFSLQEDPDAYQDNPTHYVSQGLIRDGIDNPDSGRYAPELFDNFYRIEDESVSTDVFQGIYDRPEWKITSKCNVWQIGAVMFSLLQSFRAPADAPHFDRVEPFRNIAIGHKRIVNGRRYTDEQLKTNVLTAGICLNYSEQLRSIVRRCLAWSPAARPSLEELRGIVRGRRRLCGDG